MTSKNHNLSDHAHDESDPNELELARTLADCLDGLAAGEFKDLREFIARSSHLASRIAVAKPNQVVAPPALR